MSGRKINDEQFLGALEQACGIYQKTVDLIQELYDVKITRQAVRARALNHPETLQKIRENSVLDAENTVRDIMENSEHDHLKLKAA